MKQLIELINRVLTKETILYIVFGVISTILNIGIASVLVNVFNVEGNLASTIGIIVAVIFAYFTNRKMVFNSKAKRLKEKLKEFFKFILGRIFTMIVEIGGVFLLYSIIGVEYVSTKLIMTIIVIIANFFISKFFAFKK